MKKLGADFYLQEDVVSVAKMLLGKRLCTRFDNVICKGIIVETEAYKGTTDKASHAYNGRHTQRTRIMYLEGGIAYVYLCYGIHHLFNVVTNQKGIPHAVLVRALEPVEGIEQMLERRRKKEPDYTLTSGPGSLSQAMGINTAHSGLSLSGKQIWIEECGVDVPESEILKTARVGVGYAKEDALLPYRFRIKNNPWNSPAK